MSVDLNIDVAGEPGIPPLAEGQRTTDSQTESPNYTQRNIEMLRLLNDVFDDVENASSLQTTADETGFRRSV
jgi:hypothetical protein